MVDFLEMLAANAETFFQQIPEMKGAHVYVRCDKDLQKFVPGEDVMKPHVEISIGIDIPETGESRRLVHELYPYDPTNEPPGMIASFIAQKIISDLFRFALGQTFVMFRRAELEGLELVKQAEPETPEAPAAQGSIILP